MPNNYKKYPPDVNLTSCLWELASAIALVIAVIVLITLLLNLLTKAL
jgi:hypothetical protein